jgi:hypothetical protein
MVFYYKYLHLLLVFLRNFVFKNVLFFLEPLLLGSFLIMIQNQQEFKIQTNKVPW